MVATMAAKLADCWAGSLAEGQADERAASLAGQKVDLKAAK